MIKRLTAGVLLFAALLFVTGAGPAMLNFRSQVRGLPVVYAANSVSSGGCGIVADGSNETSLLNTCIIAVQAAGGGTIMFPSGVIGVCDLTINAANGNRVRLIGQGEGTESLFASTGQGQSTLRYASGCATGAGHWVLKMMSTTYPGLLGSGIENLSIDAAGLVPNALITSNVVNSRWTRMSLLRATGYAWVITGAGAGTSRCGAGGGFNFADDIFISGYTNNAGGGRASGGIVMDTDPCSFAFGRVRIFTGDKAHGLWLKFTDSDSFANVSIFHSTDAGTIGVSGITCSGGTCTVTTAEAHGLQATYDGVFMWGASNVDLQGAFIATVTGASTFTITAPSTLSGSYSATGVAHTSLHLGNPSAVPGFCDGADYSTNCVWATTWGTVDVLNGVSSASYVSNIIDSLVFECCGGAGEQKADNFMVARTTEGWTTGPLKMLKDPIIMAFGSGGLQSYLATGSYVGTKVGIMSVTGAAGFEHTNFGSPPGGFIWFTNLGQKLTLTNSGALVFSSMPTSCSGQASGALWSNGGIVQICP